VIEAVFEEMGLKKRILAETEPHLRPDAIFATNTSALSITEISTAAKRPENVVGLHYFSPVPKMPLLEIVKTPKTAESVLQKAYELGTRQGKTCIVVNDSPGFFANRILAPYLNEAILLLEEGADMAQLDRVMKKWGFPVGPIALMDEVGIDVGAHVMSGDLMELFRQYKGVKICTALLEMNKAGLKGRKTKLGFYDYSSKKKKPNEAAYGYFAHRGSRKSFDDAEISARLSLLMLNEAARTLAEGVIATVRDGDIGAVFGIGFPPFRGGPFRYMDSVGIAQIVAQMEQAAQQFGERFAPCTLLREYAQAENRFY
jgi:3-hydroxyacyl-CoA dehydrogenase/enoyl-CoA hydratase/3-hydroxybutyryl-CoA epimerase